MKERPILFSAPMVRALLAGTKTQTRRIVKRQALEWLQPGMFAPEYVANPENGLCPYGQPGDRLWVREAFQRDPFKYGEYVYRASVRAETVFDKWTPSIHMPRRASRITLEVTAARVERLQDISEDDAKAEGICALPIQTAEPGCWWTADVSAGAALHGRTPAGAYRLLWEQINGPGSWDANPWVWVVEFRRIAP